jgi:hypothetical protein
MSRRRRDCDPCKKALNALGLALAFRIALRRASPAVPPADQEALCELVREWASPGPETPDGERMGMEGKR